MTGFRVGQWVFLGVILSGLSGCSRSLSSEVQPLTAARAAEVDKDVRVFAQAVAVDVTQNGPAAWRRHFAESPSFFMAVDGHMQFPDSASATKGIEELTRTILHIELKWGDDLRVDALAPDLAVMAASYHEVLANADGSKIDAAGFFTGTAEHRGGEWKFRNVHWSDPPAAR